jgi:multicomponent Na+:H+ antiporter subunit G
MAAIIGAFVSLIGAVFFLLAAIGLLRMPDALNRMQAGTKATTLGSILFLFGIGIMQPDYLGRVFILVVFIVLTNPVSSNALARAAHANRKRIGAVLSPDALAADEARIVSEDRETAGASTDGVPMAAVASPAKPVAKEATHGA